LPLAASLAELASSFPTAGALYHWSAMLGGRGWGFFTAWMNTIGQFAITAGIDYGLAEFLTPMLGLPVGAGHRGPTLAVYALVLFTHGVLNHIGVRAVAILNDLSAWYHMVGVAVLVAALAILAPHRDWSFLLDRTMQDTPGGVPAPYWYGFLIGLLQAQWTLTGYDASAHVTEETKDPTRNAPWGIFLSVLVSGVVGYAMLVAVTLAIGDLRATAGAPNPFIHVLVSTLGERLGNALVWMVMGAMWFCGLASVTSNSRMLFAFARDGGLPFSTVIARVSPRWKSPHVAVWVSVAAAFGVALWAEAYAAMVALSTLALMVSYAAPIAIGWWARRRGRWRRFGPWDMGRLSPSVNLVALAWVGVASVLFVLPPNQLAGKTFAGCVALLAVYWFGWMRARFAGPKVSLVDEERERAAD
jgi:amino acid transporter